MRTCVRDGWSTWVVKPGRARPPSPNGLRRSVVRNRLLPLSPGLLRHRLGAWFPCLHRPSLVREAHIISVCASQPWRGERGVSRWAWFNTPCSRLHGVRRARRVGSSMMSISKQLCVLISLKRFSVGVGWWHAARAEVSRSTSCSKDAGCLFLSPQTRAMQVPLQYAVALFYLSCF